MRIENAGQIDNLIPPRFIERDIYSEIKGDIDKKEVQIIYGPRQVGKSSLMYLLMRDIFNEATDFFYFNLDEIPAIFDSPEVFLADIQSKKKSDGTTYIFIDEIQRKEDIGLFIKYIYDKNIHFKFVVTGSSSLNIKNMVNEPLTGRKFEYFLRPLNIFEILRFKGINISKISIPTPDILSTIEDILLYGGYPQVVLANVPDDKSAKLLEISKSYITRDLVGVFGVESARELEMVAIYLSENISNILSKENISNMLAIPLSRIEKCLNALEESFVVDLLRPFYKNPVKESSQRPKVFFEDNGIRNALLRKTAPNLILADIGKLFEQMVFQILRHKYKENVKYWRNINQTEVDFVVTVPNGILAFETKYSWDKKTIPQNLKSFEKVYTKELLKSTVISKENIVFAF
ncbi:MAG: ATP-binding protein [Patescibacteria group bacterium]